MNKIYWEKKKFLTVKEMNQRIQNVNRFLGFFFVHHQFSTPNH